MPGLLSEGLHSLRSPATISALIYETREECDEVKKNKGRGRENKQALHCDTEHAAEIEADLKKFTKTFVPAAAAVHNQPFFFFLLFYSLRCQPFMAVTMARPFQRGRSPACDAFGERRHGSANNASTCSDDLREGHGRAEDRPIILSWMGARFRDHWREIFPVSAAALFEEEVLIKAALNCNQELIVKLLGVIRASHAYTALGCSAACNNTLGPWFYFSN